jgi:hypothetical protein
LPNTKALSKLALFATLAFIVASNLSRSMATEWYVDASVNASGNGETWETAFKTIQEGMDAASDGDTVIVARGTYVENVTFKGKNIILRSTDPLDPTVVQTTIIQPAEAGAAVSFEGTEDESCALSGFTLRNGSGENGGGVCGGTREGHTRATIENNTIVDNRTTGSGGGLAFCDGTMRGNTISRNSCRGWGGGLFDCDGTIRGNEISGNTSEIDNGGGLADCDGVIESNSISGNSAPGYWGDGGGLYRCNGIVRDNTISRNLTKRGRGGGLAYCDSIVQGNAILDNVSGGWSEWGEWGGGGLFGCSGVIQNNVISGNEASWDGGGLYGCEGIIQNNEISKNSGRHGGGLCECDGTIVSNTIVGNSARGDGGGLWGCQAIILNCIVWENASEGAGSQLHESNTPSFCCIQGWSGGLGNLAGDPLFTDGEGGDFRLGAESPCVDAGVNGYWFVWPQIGPDGNCRVAGGRVDVGCYEYGAGRDSDGDLLSDEDESALGTNPSEEDTDGDGLRDGLEVVRGSDPLSATAPGIIRVPSDVPTIQGALSVALAGDEIVVDPGTYVENVRFLGRDVVLRSSDPMNREIVASTVIDGGQAGPAVAFAGNESEACVLSGFIIQNGRALHGGGTSAPRDICTRATIENNVIAGNWADGWGGGIALCNGLIRNNTIAENSAELGGGLGGCSGTIEGNVIANNSASGSGGGLYYCGAMICGNIITGNSAQKYGGGLAYCSKTVRNNIISGNSAGKRGGGLAGCEGTIENNTIYGNRAERYGGLYGDEGAICNCILWGNEGGPQLPFSCVPEYSCIEQWRGGGEGNISYYPHFVNAADRDFHLASWSPCVDGGDPSSPFSEEPEPNGGRVDMGAYGNTREATSRSADADREGLPDDWEARFFGNLGQGPSDDPDADGRANMEEYRRGFDPTVFLARLWYVAGRVSEAGDGTSWEGAFKTIQQGLDVAVDGDIVTVAEGTYVENVKFHGRDVVLQSTDPGDPRVTAETVIDGNATGPAVAFDGGESEGCVLAGFTIRNGNSGAGGGILGAFWDEVTHAWLERTRATIQNNIIVGNVAPAQSWGWPGGGGLAYCDGRIRNNVISWNLTESSGGGLAYCSGEIENNVIAWNSAKYEGGGLYECDGDIRNNTAADNSAVFGGCGGSRGGGLSRCEGTIRNCIIWANTALYEAQLSLCSAPRYSCILGWGAGGTKNTFQNPRFAAGTYQLSGDSPCIDTGENDDWMWEAVDLEGNPRIFYGKSSQTVDMGAYEYGSFPFGIVKIGIVAGGGIEVVWNSRPGATCVIWSADNLLSGQWNQEATVVSDGTLSSWTGTAALEGQSFYRIEMKLLGDGR